jgi:multimeric flavodoxin WrbA
MLRVKILGLSCSPRREGNTEILVAETLDGARSEGAEVELFSVAGKEIKPCDGCQACLKTGKCHIDDDVQEVLQKMVEADGIIFGTPIYFYGMTAQAKAIMDRTYSICLRGAQMANKVGAVIAVAGGIGLMDAIKDWYFYIAINHMAAASYIGAYAGERGAIKEKEREMKMAWELGRQMVQLVDSGWRFPEEFTRRGLAAYVARKYGL